MHVLTTYVSICALQVDMGRRQEVVVYDQSSKDAGQLSKDSFVHILLSKLDGTFHRVSLLTGTAQRYFLCVVRYKTDHKSFWGPAEVEEFGMWLFLFSPAGGGCYITDSETHLRLSLSF